MLLAAGDKVLIITRRQFETDLRRHFVGEVEEWSGAVARVRGYAFVYDPYTNLFLRREDLRTRLFPIIDAGLIVVLLPKAVVLADLHYEARASRSAS